jgi:predicted metal-binding membrane protein
MKAFVFASAAVFAGGAAATIFWSTSMPDMCGGPLMAWLPMPGGTWAGSSASFLVMWMAMMVPMMIPSLAPSLWRYRQAIAPTCGVRWPTLTLAAGTGYFFVWALLGLAVYPLEVVFARAGTPLVFGAVVLGAGLLQLSDWKGRQLACCRACTDSCVPSPVNAPTAWLHGMHLGVRCVLCCGNLMAIVLVAGMMNLWVMVAVTAAITLERVAPMGAAVERATGVVVVGAGLLMLARALGW